MTGHAADSSVRYPEVCMSTTSSLSLDTEFVSCKVVETEWRRYEFAFVLIFPGFEMPLVRIEYYRLFVLQKPADVW